MNSSELYFQLPGLQSDENKLLTNKLGLHSTVHTLCPSNHGIFCLFVWLVFFFQFVGKTLTAYCPLLKHTVILLETMDVMQSCHPFPRLSSLKPLPPDLPFLALPALPTAILLSVRESGFRVSGVWSMRTCLTTASSFHLFQLL